jgi:hypothetical protein
VRLGGTILLGFGAGVLAVVVDAVAARTGFGHETWFDALRSAYTLSLVTGGIVAVGGLAAAASARTAVAQRATLAGGLGALLAASGMAARRADAQAFTRLLLDVAAVGVLGALLGTALILSLPWFERARGTRTTSVGAIVIGCLIGALGMAVAQPEPPTEKRDIQQFVTVFKTVEVDALAAINSCEQRRSDPSVAPAAHRALDRLRADDALPATPRVQQLHGELIAALEQCATAQETTRGPTLDPGKLVTFTDRVQRINSLVDELSK